MRIIIQKIKFITLLFLFSLATEVSAQQVLTLSEAVEIARRQSVDAAVALNELKTSYWEYRTYRADLLPEVNFTSTLPDYRRSYNLYQNDDGTYKFVRTNSLRATGDISIDQNIWLTGGKLSLNTSAQLIDPLNNTGAKRYYMSVPVGITYSQPIFSINNMKWKRRIEPIRYKEAKAAYLENVEIITLRTITYYFQLLLAKENLHIAEQNKKNADRIYEIAQARRKMGQISENELLQLELSALKAASNLTKEQSALNGAMFRLRSFLGLSETDTIDPVIPEMIQYPVISYHEVLEKAQQNNPLAQNIRRRQLEADYEVAKAKGAQREVDLFASIGYTGQDQAFRTAYQNLMDYQVVQVGVKIPILDWGKRKGRVKVAESNRDVIVSRLKQEQMDFNQDIFLLVEQYNNQTEQLRIARETDVIAQKRYNTSVESFMIGKINTLDLNDAQLSKDNARAKYVSEMHLYWYYLYQLRSLTLHDFGKGMDMDAEFERLIME
ncbi:TolC family protein [Proteiniphilum sp.]|uniref:TolC family protein n=1 Tax=Proteiniphilum sp. TaxID=1926877 RepID=UPI003A598A40